MAKSRQEDVTGEDPPDWYRDAIIYQLHIRAFSDSASDGVGDLGGLIGRLDYLQALGVTAIWVLPFYPSPLRDDGYDISDYTSINPQYGTMRDFRRFVREAHAHGLRVITELVLNHTSDQHPWFQRARKAPPGSRWRNFYVWSDSAQQYGEARIIFQDFEASNWTWDPVAGQYFWHRFYSHQPDLNFDSADVRRAMVRVVDRWLELGVDGLRLDAVPYLYERDGTTCENLPETHDFLRELRAHVDDRFPGRMLLAEANQWPEDAAEYFGDGDECHMAFHFPLMPRLFMATEMEDRYPIIDILQQTPEIPEGAQWALFLRNHDELTLEMVTDEERDYMYRAYAAEREARINLGIRRRLAPLLGNNRKKIELMNGLLLSLPGTPVVYYGDELGMGDNIFLGDRDSVRTPMQWSGDRNAGFSRANPQRLYLPTIIDPEFHYETINVETQLNNRASLLWFMRRLFALRQRLGVFGRGDLEFLSPENRRVLAYIRSLSDEAVLVVANLSRFAQYVELDLSRFKGSTPVELTGQTPFPAIGELPYLLTLGPHDFMWFALQPAQAGEDSLDDARDVPTIRSAPTLAAATSRAARGEFEAALAAFLPQRRWFASKARRIRGVSVRDTIPLREVEHGDAAVAIVEVDYTDGEPETYSLPLLVVAGERAERIEADTPGAVLMRLVRGEDSALVVEGAPERDVAGALLDAVRRRRRIRGDSGELAGRPTRAMRDALSPGPVPDATVSRAEQTNSSAIFGQSAIMKVFRRLEPGTNPDLEVGLHLNARRRFSNSPAVLGSLEYRPASGESGTLAIVHELVPNEGDAWRLTLDSVGRFYERILTEELHATQMATQPHARTGRRLELAQIDPDEPAEGLIGFYLDSAGLLGTRVAEMHLALAADTADEAFAPEPVTSMYQRSMYQSMRNLAARNLRLLRRAAGGLDDHARALAGQVLEREPRIMEGFRDMLGRKPEGIRIRCHGDLHLGQVLYTGKDFEIIDFEGEPARTITERRLKRSPLRDVAGMLRSFEYAAAAGLEELVARGDVSAEGEERAALDAWGRWWDSWVSSAFLRGYLAVASGHPVLPVDQDYLDALLSALVLEKATYELGYELNNRPEWVILPLLGILRETDV